MTISADASQEIEDAKAQIARLRGQVEVLLKDRVSPAVAEFAERVVNESGDMVRGQAKVVAAKVKEQPLIAIGVAAAVGWLLGRAMR